MPNDPYSKLKQIPLNYSDIDDECPFDKMLHSLNSNTMRGRYDAYVALMKAEQQLRTVREALTAGHSCAAGSPDFARIGQVMTNVQEQVAQYSEHYRVELIACTVGGYQAPTPRIEWNYENWLTRPSQGHIQDSTAHLGVKHDREDPLFGQCSE
jgi:hypothetical protein